MTACPNWKEQLREFALGAPATPALEEHLTFCAACAAALKNLQRLSAQVDAGVRGLARSAQPSPAFHARLMTALPGVSASLRWRRTGVAWTAVAVMAIAAAVAVKVRHLDKGPLEIQPQISALTHWRSPTASLLSTPGTEFLRNSPRLGESYLPLETPDAGTRKNPIPERSKNL